MYVCCGPGRLKQYTQVFNTTARRAVVLKIGSIKIDGIIYGSIDGIINNKPFARCAVSPTGANHFQKYDFQSPFLGGSLPYRGEPFSEIRIFGISLKIDIFLHKWIP